MRGFLIALALVAGGCVDGTGERTPLPEADFDLFVDLAQPVLQDRCAQASCHGNERRPLEVFAVGEHRAPDTMADDPITDAELEANFLRARGTLVDVMAAEESPLVAKPLAVAAGGTLHATGPVFENGEDDEYLALLDWVANALALEGP